MKANDIYKRVINLLGYINYDDAMTDDSALYARALHAINQILVDLKQQEVETMESVIDIPKASVEALVYGTAMMLSLIGCDSELNRVFTQIYNAKRSTALSEISAITDVLPTVIEGEG